MDEASRPTDRELGVFIGVTPCRAERWHGEPCYEGPHPPHNFTYGPNGMYVGSCSGR